MAKAFKLIGAGGTRAHELIGSGATRARKLAGDGPTDVPIGTAICTKGFGNTPPATIILCDTSTYDLVLPWFGLQLDFGLPVETDIPESLVWIGDTSGVELPLWGCPIPQLPAMPSANFGTGGFWDFQSWLLQAGTTKTYKLEGQAARWRIEDQQTIPPTWDLIVQSEQGTVYERT